MHAALAVSVLLLGPALHAQCTNEWLPGQQAPGAYGSVAASMWWDPDGAGPATPVLVLGGWFEVLGDTAANHIGAFDPATGSWSAFGAGVNGRVLALTTLPNGDLVAGGSFTLAGGLPANRVARWDGTSWHAMGNGITVVPPNFSPAPYVTSLVAMPNGDLVAGGYFLSAWGAPGDAIVRWDGSSWLPLGSGMAFNGWPPVPSVAGLAVLPNGDLVAGGHFTSAGGVPVDGLARWDGTGWAPLGGLMPGAVYCLEVLGNGDLVIAGGVHVQRWDGAQWTTVGASLPYYAGAVRELANGDLVVGIGYATLSPTVPSSVGGVYRWDGTSWTRIGGAIDGAVRSLAELPGGDLVATGYFFRAEGKIAGGLARWDGGAWSAMNPGCDGLIDAVVTLPGGDLVVAGDFSGIGGINANRIARWDGTQWHRLRSGIWFTPGHGTIHALAALPNGDVVVSGTFQHADGVPTQNIARWDGSQWHAMGAGLTGSVRALHVLPNGDLVAGGGGAGSGGNIISNLSRWDGSSWTNLGLGSVPGVVESLTSLPNGDLIVGGTFAVAAGLPANRILRWDGTSWSTLGNGADSAVYALTALANGDLVAAGTFTTPAARIARWDGTAWHPFGTGIDDGGVSALATLPNGDLVAGGFFNRIGGAPMPKIARWDGSGWRPLAASVNHDIRGMATLTYGDLVVGGNFTLVNGEASISLATLTTTCPASVASTPTSCVGPAGPITLAADDLPWTGGTFRSTATGFAPDSIPVSLAGVMPRATPLSQLFGTSALPGCDLLASPEAIAMHFGAADPVRYALALPNDPFFAGLVLHHQFLQIGTDGQGGLTSISSSNALALTIGSF